MNTEPCASEPHTHVTEQGVIVKCYHKCRAGVLSVKGVLCSPAFWIGTTATFPIEHWLWIKGPLSFIGAWMGLGDHGH